MVEAAFGRRSQDETLPFPLQIGLLPRRKRRSQDETAPFLLELMLQIPEADVAREGAALVRVAGAQPARGEALPSEAPPSEALPRLTWRGLEISAELHEYAARVAAGEELPPYRGPILASGNVPSFTPQASPESLASDTVSVAKRGRAERGRSARLVFGLLLSSAVLLASALLGDDAQLRSAGAAIGRWFHGADATFEALPERAPAAGALDAPCAAAAPAASPAR